MGNETGDTNESPQPAIDEKLLSIEKIHNDDVVSAVFKALEDIHAEALMREGMKILVKVNLLYPREPERAITTHPEVVRGVIRWLKQFNPKEIYVGDSSGGIFPKSTERALKKSGIQAVCEEEGAIPVSFNNTELREYEVKNPLVLEKITSTHLIGDVDLIVNVPKIKTHTLTTLTCAIKNMFGTIIGENKLNTHFKFPNVEDFSKALLDIYSVSNPRLIVVDGYLAQEGRGPNAGDVVKMDVILAGYNGVGIDTLVCNIIGLNPMDVPYLRYAEKKGLGSTNLNNYTIKGEKILSVFRKFKIPRKQSNILNKLPPKFFNYLKEKIFKPEIHFDLEKCRLCGTCWNNCPNKALSPPKVMDPKKYVPHWEKSKCISCFCCEEMCPYEAIEFKPHIFKNVLLSKLGLAILSAAALVGWGIYELVRFLL